MRSVDEECPDCGGTGEVVETHEPHDWWNGSGVNAREYVSPCLDCRGTGYASNRSDWCDACGLTGKCPECDPPDPPTRDGGER